MSRAAALRAEAHPDVREEVARQLGSALEQLAADIPEADAALILRLGIAYFAEVHARSFGHAATVKGMIAIARRGLWWANQELTAVRN